MGFNGRSIASVQAFADKPIREDYATEEEFLKDLAEWEEAQKGPNPDGHDEDTEHGPGVTGWGDPDTVTGPAFGGTFVNEGPGVAK